MNTNQVT